MGDGGSGRGTTFSLLTRDPLPVQGLTLHMPPTHRASLLECICPGSTRQKVTDARVLPTKAWLPFHTQTVQNEATARSQAPHHVPAASA